jgi:hypothetical protein
MAEARAKALIIEEILERNESTDVAESGAGWQHLATADAAAAVPDVGYDLAAQSVPPQSAIRSATLHS